MDKIALATTLSDNYVILFEHLIKSIIINNPEFNNDYFIFCDYRLKNENRNRLKKIYNNLIFKDCDREKYFDYGKGNIKYFSLECFNLIGYDKVIYQGSDMLCLKNHSEMLNINVDIGMNKEYRRGNFSNGNMIVGKKYINHETYEAILRKDYSMVAAYGTDMKQINQFFKDRITEISYKFNVLCTELEYIEWDEIVYIHLFHKPTIKKGRTYLDLVDKKIMKEWHKYD